MKEIELNDMKKIQLNILKCLDSFCLENNISYFLSYGTLLGSVRHKGYIPWDDDIDVCMPRPDYDKFMHSFNEKNNLYKLETFELDNKFLYTYAKLQDTQTSLYEEMTIKYPIGVNIDIFPLDGVVDEYWILKKQKLLRKLISIKSIKISNKNSFIKNSVACVCKLLISIIPFRLLVKKMILNARKNDYKTSDKVCVLVYGGSEDKPIDKTIFENKMQLPFEGEWYFVPKQYDLYLTSLFGDYMTQPPAEERVSHHSFKAYYKE
ncbi:MAG: LicD family protein [Eubacterium sp.]